MSGIIFDNLGATTRIRIYSVTGERVADLDMDTPLGKYRWDVKDSQGRDLASGGYVAVVESAGKTRLAKKLLIIR